MASIISRRKEKIQEFCHILFNSLGITLEFWILWLINSQGHAKLSLFSWYDPTSHAKIQGLPSVFDSLAFPLSHFLITQWAQISEDRKHKEFSRPSFT